MIREMFCEVWRKAPTHAARLAKIEARALKLYPCNNLRRARYIAAQVALIEGENE